MDIWSSLFDINWLVIPAWFIPAWVRLCDWIKRSMRKSGKREEREEAPARDIRRDQKINKIPSGKRLPCYSLFWKVATRCRGATGGIERVSRTSPGQVTDQILKEKWTPLPSSSSNSWNQKGTQLSLPGEAGRQLVNRTHPFNSHRR